MRRTNARTETISCDGAPANAPAQNQETAFEKQRGVSHVEVKRGYCQVHVADLKPPLMESRLTVLKDVADCGLSIDFLKFTPSGLSFVVSKDEDATLRRALSSSGVQHNVRSDRSIVMIHAVNMRDEEGLIAEIVQSAIASGAQIDHISDGHDRLLLVVSEEHAGQIAQHFEQSLANSGKTLGRVAKKA